MKLFKVFLLSTVVVMCFSSLAFAEFGFNYLERHSYSILTDWHDHDYTVVEGESSGESGLFHIDLESERFGVEAHSYQNSNVENTGTVLSINGNFESRVIYPYSPVISPYPQTKNAITLIFSCTNPVNYILDVQSAGYSAKSLEIYRIDGENESYEDYYSSSEQYTSSGQLPGPAIYQIKVEYNILLMPGEFMDESGTMSFAFEATEEGSVATRNQTWDQMKALFR